MAAAPDSAAAKALNLAAVPPDGGPHTLANYIGGQFVPAQSGATLPDLAPATGRVLATVPRSSAADVDAAVQAAHAAFPAWAATPVARRAAFLNALGDAIEHHGQALAAMESEDAGKTLAMARQVDIPRAVANFRHFAGAILHDAGTPSFAMPDALNTVTRHPLGVAALVSPWNLPLYLASWKVAPALACGNTVVLKPSEVTPRTAHALAQLAHAVGLPPGVLNVVHGLGPEAGGPLVAHPLTRLVSFTGGTATGAVVAGLAAPRFKKLSLELGGKNSCVIFGDVPLEKAVAAALRSAYTNNGQVCLAGSRVLVQRPLYDAFCAAFGAAVAKLRVGDPGAPDTDVGPVNSAAHRDKVASYIRAGLQEGGTLLAGGEGAPEGLAPHLAGGFFVRPTAFAGLDARTSRLHVEEIFGPVCAVAPFDGEDEAAALVNATPYGLCASLWTEQLSAAHRVARRLEVGIVWVNCWLHRDLRTPFGGVKASGVGREGGQYSLDFYSELRNTCVYMGPLEAEAPGPPPPAAVADGNGRA